MKSVFYRLIVCLILAAFILQGFSSAAIATPKMPLANLEELPPDDSFEYPDVYPSYLEPEQREFKPASPELIAQTHAEVMAFDCENVVDVTSEECEVLLDLYDATAGAGWTNNDGWLIGTTVGEWHGITVSNGNVEIIDFWLNNLVGTIPGSLGDLSKLTRLNLSLNNLTGSIPTELSKLENLVFLHLNGNQLSGSIPAALGKLENLNELYLHYNQLTGSIPKEIGDLNKLKYLLLNSNQLSGSIPAELGNLKEIYSLSLSYNQLSGSIPEELGALKNLGDLSLYNNQLSGSIPAELGNLKNLFYLYLHYNKLSGSIPAELGKLNNLIYLYLQNNQLSGSIPAALGDLENLNHLYLDNNKLSGSIPEKLGNLEKLGVLDLQNNQLGGSIPSELGNLEKMNYLSLEANYLSGSLPPELGNLKMLQFLKLAMNQLDGEVPEEIGELTGLLYLGLHSNAFSGDLPESVKNLNPNYGYYVDYNRFNVPQLPVIPDNDLSQAVSFPIDGAAGGNVSSRDNYVGLEIPAGAFEGEDLITFALHLHHWEAKANFIPTTLNFKLYPSSSSSPANNLSSDLMVTINYGRISLGGISEEDLHLHYYDYAANPGRWVPVEEICENTIYERDPDIDRISLNLCRLGEFALGGPHIPDHYSIFLPLVFR